MSIAESMFVQRQRRWTNINSALDQRLLFAGILAPEQPVPVAERDRAVAQARTPNQKRPAVLQPGVPRGSRRDGDPVGFLGQPADLTVQIRAHVSSR